MGVHDQSRRAAVSEERARGAAADRCIQDAAHVLPHQWSGLADQALEDVLYGSQALRDFVGIYW